MSRLEAVHPVLMVRDVASSIQFYGRIGFRMTFADAIERPTYAAVRRDSVELHLQWHDPKEWLGSGDRPTYRFLTSDVDGLWAEYRSGYSALDITEVRDTSWGTREFHLRDPDGNGLQFYRSR